MRKPVIVEFESVSGLKEFKKDWGLVNCVIVENTLTCYLNELEISRLGFYGGKVVQEISSQHKNVRNVRSF